MSVKWGKSQAWWLRGRVDAKPRQDHEGGQLCLQVATHAFSLFEWTEPLITFIVAYQMLGTVLICSSKETTSETAERI